MRPTLASPVEVEVVNYGSTTASGFDVQLILEGDSGDIVLDSEQVAALGADEAVTLRLLAELPEGLDAGEDYTLRVDVDPTDAVAELNEADNSRSTSVEATRTPDGFELEEIENLGPAQLGVVRGSMQWSGNLDSRLDRDWLTFDTLADGEADHAIELTFAHADGDLDLLLLNGTGEQIDAARSVTDNETIPLDGLPAGRYTVVILNTTQGGSGHPGYELTIDAPDPSGGNLSLRGLDWSTVQPALGQTVQVTPTIVNTGDAATPATIARLYLSDDALIVPAEDRSLGVEVAVPELQPGESHEVTLDVLIPADAEVGQQFAGLLVDPDAALTETTTNDNQGVVNFAILPPPDALESNDTLETATPLEVVDGQASRSGLTLTPDDVDLYRLHLADRGSNDDVVEVAFDFAEGRIELLLLDELGTPIYREAPTGDVARLNLNGLPGGRDYFVQVRMAEGFGFSTGYRLDVALPAGAASTTGDSTGTGDSAATAEQTSDDSTATAEAEGDRLIFFADLPAWPQTDATDNGTATDASVTPSSDPTSEPAADEATVDDTPTGPWQTRGDSRIDDGVITLAEDGQLMPRAAQTLTLSGTGLSLSFTISGFDLHAEALQPPDAFELLLVDAATGEPILDPALDDGDALLNLQPDGQAHAGDGVSVRSIGAGGLSVTVDLTGLAGGTELDLAFELLSFGAVDSRVTISDVELAPADAGDPPAVELITINDGDAQRSNIERLAARFSEPVNLAALIADGRVVDAVRVVHLPTGEAVDLDPADYAYDPIARTLTVELADPFDGLGDLTRLIDGRHELRLDTDLVRSTDGVALLDDDGLADGVRRSEFHRLHGDFDGSTVVDTPDFDDLLQHYRRTAGDPGYELTWDLDTDGDVDGGDVMILRGLAGNDLGEPPLRVVAASINDGEAQRSNFESIELSFSASTNIAALLAGSPDAIRLIDLATDESVALPESAFDYVAATHTLSIDLVDPAAPPYSRLMDGRYQLQLDAEQVAAEDGDPSLLDDDGEADGVWRLNLYQLTGDYDGSGVVDPGDFEDLLARFRTLPGDPGFGPIYDLNRDRRIDGVDVALLRDQQGQTARPVVDEFIVNDGAAQRSVIQTLELLFSRPIDLDAALQRGRVGEVVQLVDLDRGGFVDLPDDAYDYEPTDGRLTITTADEQDGLVLPLLEDGRYEVRLDTLRLRASDDGLPLVDGDGLNDGLYRFGFEARTGDFNGDGAISDADFDLLLDGYRTKAGEPGFDPILDLTRDRRIDGADVARLRELAGDGAGEAPAPPADTPALAGVVGRRLFDAASGLGGAEIALRPGGKAGSANVTNAAQGLTGLAIDLAGLTETPTLDRLDAFVALRVGRTGPPSTWAAAPMPIDVTVEPHAERQGVDRVRLTWMPGAIRDTWLEVTVKAGDATGLDHNDVFYFGSLAGDGNGDFRVDGEDVSALLGRFTDGSDGSRPVTPHDLNRDGRINIGDLLAARGRLGATLPRIEWDLAAETSAEVPLVETDATRTGGEEDALDPTDTAPLNAASDGDASSESIDLLRLAERRTATANALRTARPFTPPSDPSTGAGYEPLTLTLEADDGDEQEELINRLTGASTRILP
jgi:hypothetical protein